MTIQNTTPPRRMLVNDALDHVSYQPPRATLTADHSGNTSDASPKVLVVDDERYIVDFVGILLEEEGYQVVRAYDGQQAWDLTCSVQPDLIISDVMMPRMNGLELIRRVREAHDVPNVPVILMSAVTKLDSGWVDGVSFLPKPFDIDKMLDMVARELDSGVND